jgi:hypothetical protein
MGRMLRIIDDTADLMVATTMERHAIDEAPAWTDT